MTKEQEEAISRLRKITNRQILYGNKFGITIEGFKELQEDLETVLNMLKEKEAEIEKLRKHNKELLRKLRNRVKEVKKLQKNPNYKAIVTKQGKTLEERAEQIKKYKQLYNKALSDAVTTAHNNIKQKKIIDLMADCIRVRDIGEDFCEFNKDCTKCRNGTREIFCKDCIKQYFERKAKDGRL